MKILHVADLHARRPWLDWVSSHAKEFDLIFIAGDLEDAFGEEGMHPQARWLSAWLVALPVPTVVCTGNHDWWPKDERVIDVYAEGGWLRMLEGKGQIIAADGSAVTVGGLRIASIGWNQLPDWPDSTDIVVCHAPPPSTPVAGIDFGLGCEPDQSDLWQTLWAKPPRLFLCGHIHSPRKNSYWFPPGEQQTLILNPGCDFDSQEPYRWEIDTDRGLATWLGPERYEVRFIEAQTAARFTRAKTKARALFATDSAAEEWLRKPAPALGHKRPVDLLTTDTGESAVSALIEGIAHGNIQ